MAATRRTGAKTIRTTDSSRWYAWQGICTVLVLMALCVYAFWANLGGRRLWREED